MSKQFTIKVKAILDDQLVTPTRAQASVTGGDATLTEAIKNLQESLGSFKERSVTLTATIEEKYATAIYEIVRDLKRELLVEVSKFRVSQTTGVTIGGETQTDIELAWSSQEAAIVRMLNEQIEKLTTIETYTKETLGHVKELKPHISGRLRFIIDDISKVLKRVNEFLPEIRIIKQMLTPTGALEARELMGQLPTSTALRRTFGFSVREETSRAEREQLVEEPLAAIKTIRTIKEQWRKLPIDRETKTILSKITTQLNAMNSKLKKFVSGREDMPDPKALASWLTRLLAKYGGL